MSASQIEGQSHIDVAAEVDDGDDLAPGRGLAIGLVLGIASLSVMGMLFWWAFA